MKSTTYTHTLTVSWAQLHSDLRTLAWKLVDLRPWRGIIAIARGGLIPAAIIARELNIRHVETMCLASYEMQEQNELQVLKKLDMDGTDWLLVDDLVDSGQTAKAARQMVPEAVFATLYAKPAGRALVDITVTEVSQDTWILFPWDSDVAFTQPIVSRARPV